MAKKIDDHVPITSSQHEHEGFYSGRLGRAIQNFLFSRPSDPTGDILGLSDFDDDISYKPEPDDKDSKTDE